MADIYYLQLKIDKIKELLNPEYKLVSLDTYYTDKHFLILTFKRKDDVISFTIEQGGVIRLMI
jgi:hypothetical protein